MSTDNNTDSRGSSQPKNASLEYIFAGFASFSPYFWSSFLKDRETGSGDPRFGLHPALQSLWPCYIPHKKGGPWKPIKLQDLNPVKLRIFSKQVRPAIFSTGVDIISSGTKNGIARLPNGAWIGLGGDHLFLKTETWSVISGKQVFTITPVFWTIPGSLVSQYYGMENVW
jgi:hypothetical protein